MVLKPELLAPAGNLEKLKIAFKYGADAVYVGGHVFGLRKYADNFTLAQLQRGLDYAQSRNKKVYLVLNGFAHQQDLASLIDYLKVLDTLPLSGLIISDMGVMQLAKHHTAIPIHVSTQASVTNKYACQFFKEAGAKRIILAREVSIDDAKAILKACDIELELFVHGAMCASYSGKCIISNYSAGRDSNRGGCVQSCRHAYQLHDHNHHPLGQNHIMNAKDLNGLRLIPQLIQAGIHSLKIEGRMKSNLYVANAVKAYREAIDYAFDQLSKNQDPDSRLLDTWYKELSTVSNRSFSTGGLEARPRGESIEYHFDRYQKSVDFIGTVKAILAPQHIVVEIKTGFKKGDILELIPEQGAPVLIPSETITSLEGTPLERCQPNTLIKLPFSGSAKQYDLIRRPLQPALN